MIPQARYTALHHSIRLHLPSSTLRHPTHRPPPYDVYLAYPRPLAAFLPRPPTVALIACPASHTTLECPGTGRASPFWAVLANPPPRCHSPVPSRSSAPPPPTQLPFPLAAARPSRC